MDRAEIQTAIRASFDSKLTQSIHDATAEMVDVLVQAEVAKAAPAIFRELGLASPAGSKRMIGLGIDDADIPQVTGWLGDLAKASSDEDDDRKRGPGRSKGNLDQRTQGIGEPKALTYDPFLALDQMGYRERASGLSTRMLQEMASKCPPIAAIILTRSDQAAACAEAQPDDHSVGVKMVLADRRAKMTDELQKDADKLLDWVLHCGNPDITKRRPGLGNYLRATTRDTLTLDALTVEVMNDRRNRPAWWRPVDASLIRISDELDDSNDDEDTVRWVQVYEDTIVAEFTDSEMVYGIRNPRTDIRTAGYGFSELEMLVTIVTAILWATDYNAAFFKQGTVAKGIINFKGAIPDKELMAFRRQWYAMISGVANAWRTPVVNSDDLQWVNMQQNNRDMEFSMFIDWLLKLACAVFRIAPEEIGFQFGNSGQTSTLSEGSQGDKIKFSKDKGFVPLMKFHAEQINKIVRRIDKRFRIEFAGINARTAEELIDLQTKETASIKTIDEARKDRGLKPLPNGLGQMIRDPNWLQFAASKQGAPGGGGAPGVPQGQAFDTGGLSGQPDAQDGQTNEQGEPQGQPDEDQSAEPIAKSATAATKKPLLIIPRSKPRGRVLDLEIDLP